MDLKGASDGGVGHGSSEDEISGDRDGMAGVWCLEGLRPGSEQGP